MSKWYYFDYDILKSTRYRTQPTSAAVAPGVDVTGITSQDRGKIRARLDTQYDNLAWAAWLVRAHTAYVTRFNVMFRDSKDDADFEREIADYFNDWQMDPTKVHVRNLHDLSVLMALHEYGKVLSGDDFIVNIGGKFIGIPGERVRKPMIGLPPKYNTVTDYGFVLDEKTGAPKGITTVAADGITFEEFYPWDTLQFNGYFRSHDQYRGISPLISAYNNNQDLKENFEYTLLKIKFASFIGAVIKREATSPAFSYSAVDEGGRTEYQFEMKPGMKLELEPGDSIEFPESKQPTLEFRNFSELMLRIIAKSLDIPYTWFDSQKSSYNAMRHEQNLYTMMARPKQIQNMRVFKWILRRGLEQAVAARELPAAALNRIKISVMPYANPFLDPQREVPAAATMIAYGMMSRAQFMREHNMDPSAIESEIKKEQEAMRDATPFIGTVMPGQRTVAEILNDVNSAQQ